MLVSLDPTKIVRIDTEHVIRYGDCTAAQLKMRARWLMENERDAATELNLIGLALCFMKPEKRLRDLDPFRMFLRAGSPVSFYPAKGEA